MPAAVVAVDRGWEPLPAGPSDRGLAVGLGLGSGRPALEVGLVAREDLQRSRAQLWGRPGAGREDLEAPGLVLERVGPAQGRVPALGEGVSQRTQGHAAPVAPLEAPLGWDLELQEGLEDQAGVRVDGGLAAVARKAQRSRREVVADQALDGEGPVGQLQLRAIDQEPVR